LAHISAEAKTKINDGIMTDQMRSSFVNQFLYGLYSECRNTAPTTLNHNEYLSSAGLPHPDTSLDNKACKMFDFYTAKRSYGVNTD
jgi:hypothetical protein